MKMSQFTHVLDSNGLVLDYAVLTNPHPLTVGSSATLTVIVSLPLATGTANFSQAGFVFPLGSDPADLFTAAPTGASVSSNLGSAWTIAASTASLGNFILTPPNDAPVAMSTETLTIMFTGLTIDTPVGTAQLKINEWAAEDPAPAPSTDAPPTGIASIAIAKFPQGFFAGNFAPTAPEVQRNGTATLNWVGTPGTYTIHSGLNPPVDVSSVRTWTSPALTDTTSFLLEASAQGGSQSTFLYFSATVTVADPSIVANDLQVLTATQTSQLFVGGPATASPATAASVTGGLGTDTMTAGALTTSGIAMLAGLTSLQGQVDVTSGPVKMLGGFTLLASGTHQANGDGMLVATIPVIQSSSFQGSAVNFQVAGLTFNCFSIVLNGGFAYANTCTLPVAAGTQFTLPTGGIFSGSPLLAYWVPFGSTAAPPTFIAAAPEAAGEIVHFDPRNLGRKAVKDRR